MCYSRILDPLNISLDDKIRSLCQILWRTYDRKLVSVAAILNFARTQIAQELKSVNTLIAFCMIYSTKINIKTLYVTQNTPKPIFTRLLRL